MNSDDPPKKEPNDTESKLHNENPLSLFPMTMDEALSEVLKVKPPSKKQDTENDKHNKRKKDSR